ncbi:hypothetical protein ZIOFF_054226 [Zingiber officinale]|uniref:Uncharacterized protein n=1 Tax=Zingiber officinale TaxID=94328 RepID=A0A8J5FHE4_ZINOF|nr:hypothetical protein ZIOFF_054226 [Zingiber officinale]
MTICCGILTLTSTQQIIQRRKLRSGLKRHDRVTPGELAARSHAKRQMGREASHQQPLICFLILSSRSQYKALSLSSLQPQITGNAIPNPSSPFSFSKPLISSSCSADCGFLDPHPTNGRRVVFRSNALRVRRRRFVLRREEAAPSAVPGRPELVLGAQGRQRGVVAWPAGVRRPMLRGARDRSAGAVQGRAERRRGAIGDLQRRGGDFPDRGDHERAGAGRGRGRVLASAGGGMGGGTRVESTDVLQLFFPVC